MESVKIDANAVSGGDVESKDEERLTPLQAIRQRCLWCSNDSRSWVRNCRAFDCPLHPFRMGTDPFRAQPGKRQTGSGKIGKGQISGDSDHATAPGAPRPPEDHRDEKTS